IVGGGVTTRPQTAALPLPLPILANSTLSTDLNVRIMGYEDNKTRTSCPVGGAAGTERVPPPIPGAFQPLRGEGVAGALPDWAAARAPQQELRHHRPGRPRHQRAAFAQPADRHRL